MDIDSMIAVLQAYKDGKTIQAHMHEWTDIPFPQFNFGSMEYRVKPESVTCRCRVTHQGNIFFGDFSNLELEFLDGKLIGAKVL